MSDRDTPLDETEIALQLIGLTLEFDHSSSGPVFEDLTMDIRRGELVCILGLSGCGKTSLLNVIAGFEAPTVGRVISEGSPVRDPGPERMMVFQDAGLLPWLTLERNISLGLTLRTGRVDEKERQKRIRAYTSLVGLSGEAQKYPHQLSGGMLQRGSIARALAMEPQLLLMDEPFASLDAHTRMTMQTELVRIWGETGTTILFVTHSVEEAVFVGSRLVVMGGRPARFTLSRSIDLDRPRERTSAEFNSIKREVLEILEDGSSGTGVTDR